MTIALGGFAGVGKSKLGEKFEHIVDLESSDRKWIFTEEELALKDEERKSTGSVINPNWPNNYIEDILTFDNNFLTLISNQSFNVEYMKTLVGKGVKLYLAYPDESLINEYMQRYMKRGNNIFFLSRMYDEFESGIKMLRSVDFAEEHLILTAPDDTLESVIEKHSYLKTFLN